MRLLPLLLVCLAGCNKDKITWIQFNGDDQTLEVQVTVEPELGELRSVALTSTTTQTEVGEATVDPGTGPVGTLHTLNVVVLDDYEELVQRVTVEAQAGARGSDEFELRQDSADQGAWQVVLESLGDPGGEIRTDTFTIVLWEPDGIVE